MSSSVEEIKDLPVSEEPVSRSTTGDPQPRILPRCHLRGFEDLDTEYSYWIEPEDIQGKLPPGLKGTLYRNGPGRNKIGGKQYGHFFDGDGQISAVTFNDGRVHYKNRYVRTPKYIDETAAQKICYRGIGTQKEGGVLANAFRFPANSANTGVILHGNKLLALWEGGRPWALDPATLETIGEYNYDGMLNKNTPFSAHGTHDPRNGHFYNFGVFGVPTPKLHVYDIDSSGKMVAKRSHPVAEHALIHDFAVTENYAVFAFVPGSFKSPWKFILGLSTIAESLEFTDQRPTHIMVIRLSDLSVAREFDVPAFFGFHTGNAFEDGDTIHFDTMHTSHMIAMDALEDVFEEATTEMHEAEGTRLYRFSLNMQTGEVAGKLIPGCVPGEFPVWNELYTGVENRFTYMACFIENGTPYNFNGLQKVDMKTGELKIHDFGAGRFTSESSFIPAADAVGEDEGYLCSIVYNHHTQNSEVVLLDAKDMQEEVAVIPLKNHVPFGFHGKFYSDVFE